MNPQLKVCGKIWTFVALCLLTPNLSLAQSSGKSAYRSEVDELLTIQKVTLLPFSDNVQGIYARPLESAFSERLSKFHRWDFIPANTLGPLLTPEELEEETEKTAALAAGLEADAFFAARITKGPGGISIKLNLFLKKDSKLLAQAVLKDFQRFDINELNVQMSDLLSQILKKIPYSGRIMSRQGNRVTLNLGQRDGLEKDQVLSVIQIISLQRHPKFHFLVSSEKEILGRVKILKVDETLSFGAIVAEKDKGAIDKDAKISPLDFVTYNEPMGLEGRADGDGLDQRADTAVSFGDNPRAWLPQREPSFGQVGASLGLSLFQQSMRLRTRGGLEASSMFSPSVALNGELWLTPQWTLRAGLRQAIISVDNPYPGAQPTELSENLSYYELLAGYSYRLGGSIWDPYLEGFFGLLNYKLYVDDSSPEAYTTMSYSSYKFGLRGQAPLSDSKDWYGGGHLSFAWKPSLSEAPITSGATSENSINQFGLWGGRKVGEKIKAQVNLDFELYSSTFSGNGTRTDDARSSSQRYTTLSGALYYMF